MNVHHRLAYNPSHVLIERGRTLEVPTVLLRFWAWHAVLAQIPLSINAYQK